MNVVLQTFLDSVQSCFHVLALPWCTILNLCGCGWCSVDVAGALSGPVSLYLPAMENHIEYLTVFLSSIKALPSALCCILVLNVIRVHVHVILVRLSPMPM